MRISDWSSDVCSSDLRHAAEDVLVVHERQIRGGVILFRGTLRVDTPRALETLLARFAPLGYTPFVRAESDGVEIGRASCRERVCQYVSISVVAVSLKNKHKSKIIHSTNANSNH